MATPPPAGGRPREGGAGRKAPPLAGALAGLLAIVGCKQSAAPSGPAKRDPVDAAPVVSASAAPAAASAAPAAAPPARPARPAFAGVLPLAGGRVYVHGVGSRVLVTRGGGVVGTAEPHAALVRSPLGRGLPAPSPVDEVALVSGRWPRLLAIRGHFAGSGNDPGYRAYLYDGRSWARAGSAYDRVPSVAPSGAGFLVFEPPSFYLENGLLPRPAGKPLHPCTGGAPRPLAAAVAARAPSVPAGFFLMGLAADGSGRPAAWGYDACKPGVQIATAGAATTMDVETLPGTEACRERDPTNGFPLVDAA
ncbi:MAG TPA: hypothetical protein VFS00_28610, partial [Polyangiaceae bacterium]|nr:hypothetical protein [Polyangiaceae bacterium]